MKVALRFHDMSDDSLTEKEMIYDNFAAPIPQVGELISVEGYFYTVEDRLFVYLNNLKVDLQIIIRCKLKESEDKN
ncbi:hypothetical protein LC035_06650 [Bacillus stratosphericus]|uniref:hypothetical protein n=1 Tax=Bacillus TaxID=1386 RepID=UPI00064FC95A|nr:MULTISPECIES: hypothetical protein [Bacillus]KML17542.1 hypothetical protein VL09_08440 [Bacillus stratosphericus]KML63921.1 hypothetical protein VL19_02865 [Bacillus stratosphericus]KMN30468.1 hypothetical protein ABW26_16475 [Bacillus stratosphericus]KMN71638.1 hypothetical protein VK97_13945 [Bacillus sp. LK10]MCA1013337.1 hypothetical protein [Bacillus stratosphericus]